MVRWCFSLLLALAVLVLGNALAEGAFQVGGRVSPDGKEVVQIDYPAKMASKNTAGTNRAGLCVFTSMNYSAHWQHEKLLENFQKQMEREPGGGWPEKVDQMVAKYAPGAQYLQYEGRDLDFLRAVLGTRRLPAVTYSGADGKFYHGRVAHMVNLVHLSQKWAAIRDNNYVGENQLLWMTPEEFSDRWTHFKQGWAVVLLSPPPPPVPTLDAEPLPLPAPTPTPCPLCPPRAEKAFSWTCQEGNCDQRNLWWGNDFIGCWKVSQKNFLPYIAGSKHLQPPEAWLPEPSQEEVPDYGVRFDRLQMEERYNLNGRQVTRAEVDRQVGDKRVPNDANYLRVTVTGPKAEQVVKDIQSSAALAAWRGQLVVQAYPEGGKHWHVSGLGFPESGIVVQEPPLPDGRGRVLHQQLDYHGPEQLEQCLRNCDPKYRPALAPDLGKWLPVSVDPNFLLVGGAAVVLLLVLLWRKK